MTKYEILKSQENLQKSINKINCLSQGKIESVDVIVFLSSQRFKFNAWHEKCGHSELNEAIEEVLFRLEVAIIASLDNIFSRNAHLSKVRDALICVRDRLYEIVPDKKAWYKYIKFCR